MTDEKKPVPGAPGAPGRTVQTGTPKTPTSASQPGPRTPARASTHDALPRDAHAAKARLEAEPLPELAYPDTKDAVGFTHFDSPGSHDNLITVLTTREDLHQLASQTLVRIKSREDERNYLGVVVRGPFAEPDAISANSTMAVGVVSQGKKIAFTFEYHGRAEVEILGQETSEGKLIPHKHRPRPKSAVFVLKPEESAAFLGLGGEMCLGLVSGYERMEARLNPRDKSILPRHTGIIGTTGGGKSTTVATLIHRAQAAGIATIVFDVEGEYTHVNKPTDHAAMLEALARRGHKAEGVKDLHIYHLTGRDSRNPDHEELHGFSLIFSSLSPYAVTEILELTDAQKERFHKAYDITKQLLEEFEIFPRPDNEQDRLRLLELDEFTTGHPRMTLQHLVDVVTAALHTFGGESRGESRSRSRTASGGRGPDESQAASSPAFRLYSEFGRDVRRVMAQVNAQAPTSEVSWKVLAGKLNQLRRLKIFDVRTAPGVDHEAMLTPGRVSVVDLSDTDSPQLNNLVIADILRGLQETQEERYQQAHAEKQSVTPVLIILEEAHEFLSASRIAQMPVLFEQLTRIAKRGRKRWLGLVFVTQLPQHLPNEVLALLNNFIIHKITDSSVISRMQRSVGGIDESLWDRVSRLAPGQAIASFGNFTRPLMVAVDPAPVMRQLVD